MEEQTNPYGVREEERTKPERKRSVGLGKYVPHLILGVIAIVALGVLGALAFAPVSETQFIQNTLGSVIIAATAALAGIVKGES